MKPHGLGRRLFHGCRFQKHEQDAKVCVPGQIFFGPRSQGDRVRLENCAFGSPLPPTRCDGECFFGLVSPCSSGCSTSTPLQSQQVPSSCSEVLQCLEVSFLRAVGVHDGSLARSSESMATTRCAEPSSTSAKLLHLLQVVSFSVGRTDRCRERTRFARLCHTGA